MKFPEPLIQGCLIRRYKRFLADIDLNGSVVVAHCANPGAMIGLNLPGSEIWMSENRNPKAKLDWRWELVRVGNYLVGINTILPNKFVDEAIKNHGIPELNGYENIRREVNYGKNSRIDFLLESMGKPPCYVEVKNVHLKRDLSGREGAAEFPDSVTKRGTKHLVEMSKVVRNGARAVMLYVVQREDCDHFMIAEDLDPEYAREFAIAHDLGVEVICYNCSVNLEEIKILGKLPLNFPKAGI